MYKQFKSEDLIIKTSKSIQMHIWHSGSVLQIWSLSWSYLFTPYWTYISTRFVEYFVFFRDVFNVHLENYQISKKMLWYTQQFCSFAWASRSARRRGLWSSHFSPGINQGQVGWALYIFILVLQYPPPAPVCNLTDQVGGNCNTRNTRIKKIYMCINRSKCI